MLANEAATSQGDVGSAVGTLAAWQGAHWPLPLARMTVGGGIPSPGFQPIRWAGTRFARIGTTGPGRGAGVWCPARPTWTSRPCLVLKVASQRGQPQLS